MCHARGLADDDVQLVQANSTLRLGQWLKKPKKVCDEIGGKALSCAFRTDGVHDPDPSMFVVAAMRHALFPRQRDAQQQPKKDDDVERGLDLLVRSSSDQGGIVHVKLDIPKSRAASASLFSWSLLSDDRLSQPAGERSCPGEHQRVRPSPKA